MSHSAAEALQNARAALREERFFDGVQLVNAALEAQGQTLGGTKGGYSATPASTEADGTEILRTPEVFLNRVMTTLTAAKKKELADFFTVRTDLLVGLGALKRAVVDVSAALLLRPEDEALAKKKTDLEGRLAGDTGLGTATKTPTSIITGFLGAGKTTLLNYILEQNHGKKIAIIENEFGEVGIDDALLNTKTAVTEENVIEMNNGCICCTVRGDLIAGLKKLHKQTTGKGKPLDGIIIETTGLADPAPVAQTFFADDFVSANMVLDGILTVVDCKHIIGQLQEDKPEGAVNEAVEQIAFADRILLNKTDLVSDAELDEVQREVRRINKTAAMKRTKNSQVDMDFILGIEAFSLERILMQVSQGNLEEEESGHGQGGHGGHGHHGPDEEGHDHHDHDGHCCHEDHGAGCGHEHAGHGEHAGHHAHEHNGEACDHPSHRKRHDYRVSSVGIQRDREVVKDKLDKFIGWLIQQKGPDLYRSKGVLAVQGLQQKFVFHAVHMQFSGKPQEAWREDEKRCCKMVFIGKNMDREELNKKFDECLA
ncbi:Cbwd1 [Symbiodinium sp. CCMP2592]|nr:Cbwd1 [Symbiodinium sp. CCMP2592]